VLVLWLHILSQFWIEYDIVVYIYTLNISAENDAVWPEIMHSFIHHSAIFAHVIGL